MDRKWRISRLPMAIKMAARERGRENDRERLEACALLAVQGNIGHSSNEGRITISSNSTSGYVLQ